MIKDVENQPFEGIIVGRNPVLEALKGNRIEKILVAKGEREGTIIKIIAIAKSKGIVVVDTDRITLNNMSKMASHQGVAAFVTQKDYCEVEDIINYAKEKGEKPFIIIADGITDPHNLGAIIRTADACGVHGIIIPKRRSVGMTAVVFKSSAGAAEHIRVAKVSNITNVIDELKVKGIWIFGADISGDTLYYQADYSCPCALIVGSEGQGMSRLHKEKCDYLLKIPMKGELSSLNASVASAILMYEVLRKRNI